MAGGCLVVLFQDRTVVDFYVHRKVFRGNLRQVNIPIATNFMRVLALQADKENR